MNRFWNGGLWSQGLQWATGALGLLPIGLAIFSLPVFAQIVPDNTLGSESSQVTPNVNIRGLPTERIDGGAVRGSALFHSFSEFNVNNGQRVYFSNPAGIADIFSRVTGSNVSNILGTLGVDGGANLFVLNPNGILFGPNAQLDIQGSFLATTGSGFKFSDGSEFSVTAPNSAPLLSINVTPGVQWGASQPGATITNRGNLSAGQDLTLAAGNLDLQGQLQAGRDLTLQAQDTVKVRATATQPVVVTSGRHLTMQGNQNVDILALNHPQSQLQSGGNFTLISDGNISGDAHFFSGGNLSMLTLAGNPGNFVSWFDPIISANGDVQFGNYTGVALKVEATGSIQGGDIRITAPECVAGSAGCVGGIPATDPDFATLTERPSVILRAGLASVSTPNLPQDAGGASFTGASEILLGITVGNIDTSRSDGGNGGDIILFAANGNIFTGNLNSSSTGNGGAIALTAGGNISTSNINSYSYSEFSSTGNGGAIALTAGDNISTNNINSFSYSEFDFSGNGGAVALTTGGNISISNIDSQSFSYSFSGNGGVITLTAEGNIFTSNIGSYSSTGNGGAIALTAGDDISTSNINSYSYSEFSSTGNGGAIALTAGGNIFTSNIQSYSYSYYNSFSGNGGAIALTAGGNITTSDINSVSYSEYDSTGNGGAIALTAGGNISISNIFSYSESDSYISGNGGAIALTAGGNISIRDIFSFSSSYSFSGNGGAIALTAGDNISTSDILSFSYSVSDFSRNGGAIALTAGGNISTSKLDSYSYAYTFSENGGDITLSGSNITAKGDLNSFSYSVSGNSGNGGLISLRARDGDILGNSFLSYVYVGDKYVEQEIFPRLNSFSISEQGIAGNGGEVTLEARNNVSNLELLTLSSSAQAGRVQVTGFGDLSLTNTNILTGNELILNIPRVGLVTLDIGKTGQSGDVTVTSLGNLSFNNSRIDSNTKSSSPAGNVTITSPGLVTFNNSQIVSNTTNTGQAGNITVKAPELQLDADSMLSAETSISGRAGDLTLQPYEGGQTLSVFLPEGAKISASTANIGQGGNITITAPESVTISGKGSISATTSSSGEAGSVTINTPTLTIDGTQISTSTSGSGRGGDLTVNASNSVTLSGDGQLSAETTSSGQAGNVNITTPTLNINTGANVSTTTTQSATGTGGDITVSVNTLNLAGANSGLFAETQGAANAGNLRLKPYSGNDLQVDFAQGAKVSASTSGSGTGGNLTVNAPDSVTLSGDGQLSAEATNGGNAGKLEITANQLTLRDNSSATVSSTGNGTAGNLTVNAPVVLLNNQAKLTATTQAGSGGDIQLQNLSSLQLNNNSEISASTQSGTGGSVSINAPRGSVAVTSDSNLKAEATDGGNAGNLEITANQLTLREGSSATVSSPQGQAGNLSVTANNLLLDRGELTAETGKRSDQGGANINLQVTDLLLLRHNSLISANATGDANGGNITIKAPFVVAVPSENNDIIANAFSGDGGQINIIDNYRVFGLKPQNRQSFDSLRQNGTSDISASSQSGIQGVINIQSLSVDPSQGLTALPVDLVDSSRQIVNRCGASSGKAANAQGEFVVTGRGGLPPSPDDMQRSGVITPGWVTRDAGNISRVAAPVEPPAIPSTPPLVEAQGMFINAQGEVVLTAQTPTTTPHQPGFADEFCSPATSARQPVMMK